MVRGARNRRRTLSRRRVESPRIDLRGPQRKAYLGRAGFCLAIAVVPVGLNSNAWFSRTSDWVWLLGWAALLTLIAAYHVRVAYGWVHIDPLGLHTSRLWRGRYLQWADIEVLETKTWYGKGGGVTLVQARTRSGRSYYLPAPRATSGRTDEAFYRQLRQLSRHVPGQ